MPTAPINGIELYYESHGSGDAVVFAHGRGGNRLSWWQQIPAFAARHRCIVLDQRGFGQSPDAPDGPGRAAFVDDLRGLLDHLGIRTAYLVGQSMGGLTTLGFALAYPERALGLVLAGTTGGIADPAVQAAFKTRGPLPADVTARALSAAFRRDEPAKTVLFTAIGAVSPPERDPSASLFGGEEGRTAADLARFTVPTLFVVGGEDLITPVHVVEAAAKCVPGTEVKVVDGAGHSAYYEQPERFNDLVLTFFASISRPRRA
jgi:3-oxoadipate enol-lactonase